MSFTEPFKKVVALSEFKEIYTKKTKGQKIQIIIQVMDENMNLCFTMNFVVDPDGIVSNMLCLIPNSKPIAYSQGKGREAGVFELLEFYIGLEKNDLTLNNDQIRYMLFYSNGESYVVDLKF